MAASGDYRSDGLFEVPMKDPRWDIKPLPNLLDAEASYRRCRELQRVGVEVIAVAEPPVARLDRLARSLISRSQMAGSEAIEPLVQAVKSVRWKALTTPVPFEQSATVQNAIELVHAELNGMRGTLAERSEGLVQELDKCLKELTSYQPAIGQVLKRSLAEVGSMNPAVLLPNFGAKAETKAWFALLGIEAPVVSHGDLRAAADDAELVYAIGPPRFFNWSLFSSGITDELIFIVASWFRDWELPASHFLDVAEEPVSISCRVQFEGGTPDGEDEDREVHPRDKRFLPQPIWEIKDPVTRERQPGEVIARRVLLAGERAIWLDNGDRIRCLDPILPEGERVFYVPVPSVGVGTILVLREGVTLHGVPLEMAVSALEAEGIDARGTQIHWKHALSESLRAHGESHVQAELQKLGVIAYSQVRSWVESTLTRPSRDSDFLNLLSFLGLSDSHCFNNATRLRSQASIETVAVRERLETAVALGDLEQLQRSGYVAFDIAEDGFRGIIATRVLAISETEHLVPRNELRRLQEDRNSLWLA